MKTPNYRLGNKEPKHISDALSDGVERLNRLIEKMKAIAPETELGDQKQEEEKRILAEYAHEIETLYPSDREVWDTWQDSKKAEILMILSKIRKNRYFGKSKPPIDLTFLIVLCSQYDVKHVKEKLNKAYLWLLSNPDKQKKNYRKFIMNFMDDLKYNKNC